MKHDEAIGVRLTPDLKAALERERKRLSETAGADVSLSFTVRAVLRRELLTKGRKTTSKTSRRAA